MREVSKILFTFASSYLKASHSNAKRCNMPKYAPLPNHYLVFQRHLQLADYREVECSKCFSVKGALATQLLSEVEVRKIEAEKRNDNNKAA